MYDFKQLACMSQEEIKQAALSIPDAYEITDGNVFIKGSLPLVLVAHMDTVYSRALNPSDIIEKNGNLYTKKHCGVGIGGDDRCGCWVLFQVAQWSEQNRPSLLFCSDEETCQGSSVGLNLLDWSEYKAFIEIDGPNYNVFYSDSSSNDVLDEFMSEVIGLYELPSSYNDISEICTTGNPPGITLGAGYYHQHQANKERVNLFGLNVVLDTVKQICDNLDALDWSVVPAPKKKAKGKTTVSTKSHTSYADPYNDVYWDYYGKMYDSKYTDDDYGIKDTDDTDDYWDNETDNDGEDIYDDLGFDSSANAEAFDCDPAKGTCEDCCLCDECDDWLEWNKLNEKGL